VKTTQRKRLMRWSQKAKDKAPAAGNTDRSALPRNPVESTALRMRTMGAGNGVTPNGSLWGRSPHGVGANQKLLGRRMPEEAHAWSNAQDRLTSGRCAER
jgi:hypothetical protein